MYRRQVQNAMTGEYFNGFSIEYIQLIFSHYITIFMDLPGSKCKRQKKVMDYWSDFEPILSQATLRQLTR
jgi:hypothetical protein